MLKEALGVLEDRECGEHREGSVGKIKKYGLVMRGYDCVLMAIV